MGGSYARGGNQVVAPAGLPVGIETDTLGRVDRLADNKLTTYVIPLVGKSFSRAGMVAMRGPAWTR